MVSPHANHRIIISRKSDSLKEHSFLHYFMCCNLPTFCWHLFSKVTEASGAWVWIYFILQAYHMSCKFWLKLYWRSVRILFCEKKTCFMCSQSGQIHIYQGGIFFYQQSHWAKSKFTTAWIYHPQSGFYSYPCHRWAFWLVGKNSTSIKWREYFLIIQKHWKTLISLVSWKALSRSLDRSFHKI